MPCACRPCLATVNEWLALSQTHNAFACMANTMLFFTLFAGLFIKLKVGFTSKGIYGDGISIDALVAVLITCAGSVFLLFFVQVFFSAPSELQRVAKTEGHLSQRFLPHHILSIAVKQADKSSHSKASLGREKIRHAHITKASLDERHRHFPTIRWLWGFVVENENSARAGAESLGWMLPPTPFQNSTSIRVLGMSVMPSKLRFLAFLNKCLEYDSKYNGPSKGAFSLDEINWGQQGLNHRRNMMVRFLQAYPEVQGRSGDQRYQRLPKPIEHGPFVSPGFKSSPKWKPGMIMCR